MLVCAILVQYFQIVLKNYLLHPDFLFFLERQVSEVVEVAWTPDCTSEVQGRHVVASKQDARIS